MVHSRHTTKVFDSDLQELARAIAEMGGLAERQIAEAMEALTARDSGPARRIVAADATIDAMQRNIEKKAIETIARRQPVAGDLREIVGILRIANEIERIAILPRISASGSLPSTVKTYRENQCAASARWLLSCWLSCGMSSTASPAATSRRRSRFGCATKTSTGCARVYRRSFSLI